MQEFEEIDYVFIKFTDTQGRADLSVHVDRAATNVQEINFAQKTKTVPVKAECLAHIKEVWTDMRPLSLRKRMDEAARGE